MLKVEQLNSMTAARRRRLMERCQERIFPLVFMTAGPVVEDIRAGGDRALVKYIRKFEKKSLKPAELIVKKQEIASAKKALPAGVHRSINLMIRNVRSFYARQARETGRGWKRTSGGYTVGQLVRPVESVGVYVPGGTAAYPSTAVMGIVPAKIAGVKKIVLATPCGKDKKIPPAVLVAAEAAGAELILKAGGMQAIGAMAVGTGTVPRVDKIIGPGNIWVSAAKMYVSMKNYTSIDFVAGPSEVLIIAGSTADGGFIARDMLAQAEHDPHSSVVLVTVSKALARDVCSKLGKLAKSSARRKTIEAALGSYGAVIVAPSMKKALEFANDYAPEHLQIMVKNPEGIMKSVKNAGSIFLGGYTPVALGDYLSGTNHILPTGGGARHTCGVNVETFLRRPTFQQFGKKALAAFRSRLVELARLEGLAEHGESVEERFREGGKT